MRLPAKPYQNAIASAVHRMAERKNSFGRGKNETNIVCIQSQLRGFCGCFTRRAARGKGFQPLSGQNDPPPSLQQRKGAGLELCRAFEQQDEYGAAPVPTPYKFVTSWRGRGWRLRAFTAPAHWRTRTTILGGCSHPGSSCG